MKQLFTLLLLLPTIVWAQSVTITSSNLPAALCPGASITVNYTSTGDFMVEKGAYLVLVGVTGSGLVFHIGSTSTTAASGTVTATIPASLQSPAGEYYVVVERYRPPYGYPVQSPPTPSFILNVAKTPTVLIPEIEYCLNDAAVSMASSVSAIGTLNWYSSSSDNVASSQSPTPSTSQLRTFDYYVSQTERGCESPRTAVSVRVMSCNYSQGYQSGPQTGSFNTFLGARTGYANTTGSSNVFIGYQAGFSNASGSNNSFFGYSAGRSNTIGTANTLLGWEAGSSNKEGSNNTLIGYRAGGSVTGTNNTFLGYQSGRNVTTGSNNIIVGPMSGTAITDGSDNVLMGYNSQAEDGLHNATAIGAGSRVAVSNALILGNGVNVGIGTSAPATRLEVVSPQADQSGLRLTSLTTNSPSVLATDQFLTVNPQGDVVKARYQLRISDVSQWSDKVFSPTYQLRPLSQVATYVREQCHLPGVPSAEQVKQEGVDLVKMNSLLLEKVEELTLYGIEQEKRLDKQQGEIDELKRLVKQLLKK